VDLDPTGGAEINKRRPCVVVQRDAANETSPTTIIAPLGDARGTTGNVLNVFIAAGMAGTRKDSVVICNQIRTVDGARIGDKIGSLPTSIMAAVEKGLRLILDL
ncbi:MAG: type II toxin-antitoxin system PemK/MazF family toxin, partial [bacterium]|nr:type II toxin-antitoxin system PemK/MazF family toxin [bacterium]